MKVRKAVIPAAGFGTRFLPATKAIPKEMLNIVDKPVIHYNIQEILDSGIEEILIITGRHKDSIMDYFDKSPELEDSLKAKGKETLLDVSEKVSNMANIHFVRQKEALGLGHAVYCAKTFVGKEPFALLLGDDLVYSDVPATKQLCDAFEEHGKTILGVQRVAKDQVEKYGIADVADCGGDNRSHDINKVVEKPSIEEAPSDMAILGRYVLTPAIFEALEKIERGKGGEFQLTDALDMINKEEGMMAYEFEGKRYDAGDKLGYLKATVEYALRDDHFNVEFEEYIKELAKELSK